MLSTRDMGDVIVTPMQLRQMQAGEYILHARDGKLEKVQVHKVRLPVDPKGHYQGLSLIKSPDGTLYASQTTVMSRSTDAGKTWEHLERDVQPNLQFTRDGQLLAIRHDDQQPGANPTIWSSSDEGLNWAQIGHINVSAFNRVSVGASMISLQDGALVVPIKHRASTTYEWPNPLYTFRSTDGGRTFPKHNLVGPWLSGETNLTELPSGRLLAVIRHQPGPPDQPAKRKTLFLADSANGGSTWTNLRKLTTEYGQCHGAAAGLSGDRVVVAHDHRYPRQAGSCRAMVSHDGGQNWLDEVYYLCHGNSAGYPRHVTLDADEILTKKSIHTSII